MPHQRHRPAAARPVLALVACTLLAPALRAVPAAAASNPLADRRVESLASFSGRIWAGTDVGLYVLGSNGAWTVVGGTIADREVPALAVSGTWLVAGTNSGVLRSQDGSSWAAAGLNGEQVDSLSASGATLLAGTGTESGGNGYVQRSGDSGATWTAAPLTPALSGLPGDMVNAVLVASGSAPAWAGTGGGGALHSTDGSGGWSTTTGIQNSEVTSLWRDPSASSRLLAGSDDGLYSWTGSAWTTVSFPLADPWVGAMVTGGDGHPVLGTVTGEVFAERAGGGWTQRASGLSTVYSLLAVSGGGVLVGTDTGVACVGCPSTLAAAASPGPKRSGAATVPPPGARPGASAAASGSSPTAGGLSNATGATSAATGGAGGTTGTAGSGGSGDGSARWWIVGGLVALSAVLLAVGRLRSRRPGAAGDA